MYNLVDHKANMLQENNQIVHKHQKDQDHLVWIPMVKQNLDAYLVVINYLKILCHQDQCIVVRHKTINLM